MLYRACTRSYSVGLQLRRHLFYCSTWISPCWLLHTGSTQIHIIPTGSRLQHEHLETSNSSGCVLVAAGFRSIGSQKSLFFGVLTGPKSLFCFTPLHVILKIIPHTAARCCKKQQRQKTPRAQQYTLCLLIPYALGKLNVKHHRTTPKPEMHIIVEKEAALL